MSSSICLKLGHVESPGQKLGHLAKSAENLVNTLAVTFLKQSSRIWLKMFVLMISRSRSKLEHLGSNTRSPGQISIKSYHSSGHIFQAIIMNLAENVGLDEF